MGARYNLLYVFADQWRKNAMGCMEVDPVRTPHMDAFAKESVSCDAISSYPLCSPHRAALLAGKHPLACGFWTNCKAPLADSPDLKDSEVCLSDVLSEAGYQTAYIGKWHLRRSELNDNPHPQSGARGWDAYIPAGKPRHGFQYWHAYNAYDQHTAPHYWEDSPTMEQVDQWSPRHETDVLLSYLQNRKPKQPFCAFLSWNPPHPPYDALPVDLQRHQFDLAFEPNVPDSWKTDPAYRNAFQEYLAAVEGLDEQFGRIVSYLKESGLWDSTIVVLASDHGDCMGSHGRYGKNIYYEESIQIPWYLHAPALQAGKADVLLASEDQAPTLLSLMGMPVPKEMTGMDQSEAFCTLHKGPRNAVYLCMIPGMPDLVAGFRDKGLDPKGYGWRGVRTRSSLYVIDKGTEPGKESERFCYDLRNDPYELHVLKPTKAQRDRWESWMRKQAKEVGDVFFSES